MVYALAILAILFAQVLPIKIPFQPNELFPFFLSWAFAAGLSDWLVGQTVSQLIKSGVSDDRRASK
jgi:hypothetical protein